MARNNQCKNCGNYQVVQMSQSENGLETFCPSLFSSSMQVVCDVDFCNRLGIPIEYDDNKCDLFESDDQTQTRLKNELDSDTDFRKVKIGIDILLDIISIG